MLFYIYKDINIKKDKAIQYNKLKYDFKTKKMDIEIVTKEKDNSKKQDDVLSNIKKNYTFDLLKDNKNYYLIDTEDDIEDFLYENHIRYDLE